MTRYLLLLSLGITLYGRSQTTVSEWQAAHPGVLLMTDKTFDELSPELRSQLDGRVVVYKGTLKAEDLAAFSLSEEKNMPDHTTKTEDDAQFLKDWIGTHQNVKIVTRSVYDDADADIRLLYIADHALILAGESITITDIQNYHP